MQVYDLGEDYDYCTVELEEVPTSVLEAAFGEPGSQILPSQVGYGWGWEIEGEHGIVTVTGKGVELPVKENGVAWVIDCNGYSDEDDPGAAVGEVLNAIRSEVEHRELESNLKAAEQ